ncbi:hypothetical protein Tco_1194770 [Tanacetum coccineum]
MESSPLMNAMAVENVVENESHFSLEVVDQDLSSLAMFTKHLMGRGGGVGSNSGVGEGKEEFMGGIGGGSFAKRSMVAKDGLGGDGFVVDGGRSPSTSSKDGEDGGVENKSSMGSRLIVTGEFIVVLIGDSGGVVIGEVGGAPARTSIQSTSAIRAPFQRGVHSRDRRELWQLRMVMRSRSVLKGDAVALDDSGTRAQRSLHVGAYSGII